MFGTPGLSWCSHWRQDDLGRFDAACLPPNFAQASCVNIALGYPGAVCVSNLESKADRAADQLEKLAKEISWYGRRLELDSFADGLFVLTTADGKTLDAIVGGGYALDSGIKPKLWGEKEAAFALTAWNRSESGAKFPVVSMPWRDHFQSHLAR